MTRATQPTFISPLWREDKGGEWRITCLQDGTQWDMTLGADRAEAESVVKGLVSAEAMHRVPTKKLFRAIAQVASAGTGRATG